MSLPLLVRPMAPSETNLVLAAWKTRLYADRFRWRWGRQLDGEHFWLLVNHVLDRLTLPSSQVLVGCYETEQNTPICWMAVRRRKSQPLHDVLYADARPAIRDDLPLAAALEREFTALVERMCPLGERLTFNPFQELSR